VAKLKVKEFAEEKENKGRGLWKLGILPSAGRKYRSSGGSTVVVTSTGEKRSRPLVFTSKEQQEECTGRIDLHHQIGSRYPSVVGSTESRAWFNT
jgi:hypothetical protein